MIGATDVVAAGEVVVGEVGVTVDVTFCAEITLRTNASGCSSEWWVC